MEAQVTIKKCIVADPDDWRELRRRAVDLGTDASALTRLIVRSYLEGRLQVGPDAGPAPRSQASRKS
jgi:hypothetical protein